MRHAEVHRNEIVEVEKHVVIDRVEAPFDVCNNGPCTAGGDEAPRVLPHFTAR